MALGHHGGNMQALELVVGKQMMQMVLQVLGQEMEVEVVLLHGAQVVLVVEEIYLKVLSPHQRQLQSLLDWDLQKKKQEESFVGVGGM